VGRRPRDKGQQEVSRQSETVTRVKLSRALKVKAWTPTAKIVGCTQKCGQRRRYRQRHPFHLAAEVTATGSIKRTTVWCIMSIPNLVKCPRVRPGKDRWSGRKQRQTPRRSVVGVGRWVVGSGGRGARILGPGCLWTLNMWQPWQGSTRFSDDAHPGEIASSPTSPCGWVLPRAKMD